MYSIIDYSSKAIALTGDTRPIKDQLKNLGGRFNPRLSCGAGWIFSKKTETALRKFLGSLDFPQETKTIETQKDCGGVYKNALREYAEDFPENAGKYWVTEALGALRIREGYIFAQRPQIETRFWFHDEGPLYEYYLDVIKSPQTKKAYFFEDNFKKVSFSEDENYYIVDDKGEIHCGTFCKLSSWYPRNEIFEFSAEELEQVKAFYEWQKQLFEKRLNTYIKRWGVEKLSFDTYWADR